MKQCPVLVVHLLLNLKLGLRGPLPREGGGPVLGVQLDDFLSQLRITPGEGLCLLLGEDGPEHAEVGYKGVRGSRKLPLVVLVEVEAPRGELLDAGLEGAQLLPGLVQVYLVPPPEPHVLVLLHVLGWETGRNKGLAAAEGRAAPYRPSPPLLYTAAPNGDPVIGW